MDGVVRMEKKILLGMLGFLLLSPIGLAQNYSIEIPNIQMRYTCVDNDTIKAENSAWVCINSTCQNITREFRVNCEYGCDSVSNSCAPKSIERYAIIFGVFIAFCLVLFLLFKIKR